jgi:KAP family P-loop domain
MTSAIDLLLAIDPADADAAKQLARRLDRFKITTRVEAPAASGQGRYEASQSMVRSVRVVAIGIPSKGLSEALLTVKSAAEADDARSARPLIGVLLPGADPASVPPNLRFDEVINFGHGVDDAKQLAVLASIIRRAREEAESGRSSAAEPPDSSDELDASEVEAPENSAAESEVPLGPVQGDLMGVIFERLNESAIRALAAANDLSIAHGLDRLHAKELLVGLYESEVGGVRWVLASKGVGATELEAIVGWPVDDIAPRSSGAEPALDRMPRLSAHVRDALVGAVSIADEKGSPHIHARHIFYGFLELPSCTPVNALRDEGITSSLIQLDGDLVPPEGVVAIGGDVGGVDQPPVVTTPAPPSTTAAPIAGFRSDDPDGRDLLDIKDEVEALATVMAAVEVKPPLALGLFGDWGTGKTFFMNMLYRRIAEIADAERAEVARDSKRNPKYCQDIVQLRFNAWHYIDQDLWASLASAIFDGLDLWISNPSDDPTEVRAHEVKRAGLLTMQSRKQDDVDRAERQRTEARQSIDSTNASLAKLDAEYDELAKDVGPVAILGAAARIAAEQPEIAESTDRRQKLVLHRIDAAANEFDLTSDELRKDLARGPAGWLSATGRSLGLQGDWRLSVWMVVIVIVCGILIVLAGRPEVEPVVQALVVLGSAFAILLRPVIYPAARILGLFRQAQGESKRLLDAARERQRTALLEIKRREEERAAQADLAAATAKAELDDVRKQLIEVAPSREMATFVKRRQSSADYRSRLGVVATARDDFDELTKLLGGARREPPETTQATEAAEAVGAGSGVASASAATNSPQVSAETAVAGAVLAQPTADDGTGPDTDGTLFRPIDRIVLYIDDLDRCKESEVVAVLQAVHLLLAFPLFVVIVAVDPRWLLHSLRVTSRVLERTDARDGEADEDELGWEATPLNYLEKIFQIPFALRPMDKDGFAAMIHALVPPSKEPSTNGTGSKISPEVPVPPIGTGVARYPEGAAAPVSSEESVTPPTGQTPGTDQGPEAEVGDQPSDGPTHAKPTDTAAEQPDETKPRPVNMSPGPLDIGDQERAYMAWLHELIGTPRAAKRFVNVYRLLKASAKPDDLPKFADPTYHQPILILLAILTGYPAEATDILRAILDERPKKPWLEFIRDVCERSQQEIREAVRRAESKASADKANGAGDQVEAGGNGEQPELTKPDPREERWTQLVEKLERIGKRSVELDSALFWRWVLPVARYGFESSRILANQPPDESDPAGSTASAVGGSSS